MTERKLDNTYDFGNKKYAQPLYNEFNMLMVICFTKLRFSVEKISVLFESILIEIHIEWKKPWLIM